MALAAETVKSIEDFVQARPRTIQEVSLLLGKNWRTAESYVERISLEHGTLAMHTFRGGTKGALKLVYWQNVERPHSSAVQERLFRQVQLGRSTADFSPMDIYQFVSPGLKEAYLEAQEDNAREVKQDLVTPLRSAREQVLIFSGNLSWANLVQEGISLVDVFEELAEAGVGIKFLTMLDISSLKNYEKIAAVNTRLGRDAIEIRHGIHPLRAFIVDNSLAQFKETKHPADYERGELQKKTYIFYRIRDPEWVGWCQKVFWNLFRTALPAEKRIENLRMIEGLQML